MHVCIMYLLNASVSYSFEILNIDIFNTEAYNSMFIN